MPVGYKLPPALLELAPSVKSGLEALLADVGSLLQLDDVPVPSAPTKRMAMGSTGQPRRDK
jgi:hypothetical protein